MSLSSTRALCAALLCLLSDLALAGWETRTTPNRQDIFAFYGASGLDVFAVGQGGYLIRSRDGGDSWTALPSPTKEPLFSIWGVGNALYTVGQSGTLLLSSNEGASWQSLTIEGKNTLRSVWGSSPDDIYIVGEQGTILHSTDGQVFTAQQSGVSVSLFSIWGSGPDNIYAVGEKGTIVHSTNQGKTWSLLNSGTTELLRSVHGASARDVFVVGYGRTILHSQDNGASWINRSPHGEEWLGAVRAIDERELCIVGAKGLVLRSHDAGLSWQEEKNDTLNPLYAIWAKPARQLRIGGKAGLIVAQVLPKPTLIVTDGSNADGAEIFVDGENIGKIPNVKQLSPGRYFVEVKRPLFDTYSQWVDVQDGDSLNVPIALSPVKTVLVFVEGPKGAQVSIDGVQKGAAPLSEKVSPGKHTLSLQLPGFFAYANVFTAIDEDLTLSPEMQPIPNTKTPTISPKTLLLSAGAAAGLSLLPMSLGVSNLVKANDLRSQDFVDTKGDLTQAAAEYQDRRTKALVYGAISDGLWVASIGGAVGAYVLHQKTKEESKVEPKTTLQVSPKGAALQVKF